jgi:hypothetical protein
MDLIKKGMKSLNGLVNVILVHFLKSCTKIGKNYSHKATNYFIKESNDYFLCLKLEDSTFDHLSQNFQQWFPLKHFFKKCFLIYNVLDILPKSILYYKSIKIHLSILFSI